MEYSSDRALSDLLLYVEDIMFPTKYKRMDFNVFKHNGSIVGNNDHSYLLTNDSTTGICTDKPGTITLDFANEFLSTDIVSIECKAYHGNKEFYAGNGANALISISSDNVKKISAQYYNPLCQKMTDCEIND